MHKSKQYQLISLYIKYNFIYLFVNMHSDQSPTKVRNTSTKTQNSIIAKPTYAIPATSSQFHKVMKSLQKIIKHEKQKRQRAEEEIDTYKNRLVDRELQFKRIIEKYKTKKQVLQPNSEIDILFNQILENFDKFNSQTQLLIEQKYEESLNSMTRRIRQIMQHVNQWIVKSAAKVKNNPQNLKQEMRVLYETATQIEDKNIQMVSQIKNLKFENKLLREQRQMIIEQLMRKKNKITNLNQQLSHLKESNAKLEQQNIHLKASQIRNSQKHALRISNFKQLNTDMKSTRISTSRKKSESEIYSSTISNFNCGKINEFALAKRKSYKQSVDLIQDNKNTAQFRKNKSQFNHTNNRRIFQGLYAIPIVNKQKIQNDLTIENLQMSILRNNKNKNIMNCNNNHLEDKEYKFIQQQYKQGSDSYEKKEKQKIYYYVQTIQNLRKTLKRQKARVVSLGSVVSQITAQNKEVNNAIENIINQSKDSGGNQQPVMEYSKLFNTLKVLKQRLRMIQNPVVSCGWDDSLIDI